MFQKIYIDLERNLSVDDVNVRREPVQDSSHRVGVKECHRASHDPEQKLFVDQLRRFGAAQQEGQVHRDLEDCAAGTERRIDSQVFDQVVVAGVFAVQVGPVKMWFEH